MPSWKHGCSLAAYLTSFDQGRHICSFFVFGCLRSLRRMQPDVRLLFLTRLAQELAEQLDSKSDSQLPVIQANVPLSDSQIHFLSQRNSSPCVSHLKSAQNARYARCSTLQPPKRGTKMWNCRWLMMVTCYVPVQSAI